MFFPNGVNVNFAKILDDNIKIRTFEKGVEGETLACGTGCAAVAFILQTYFSHKNFICFQYPTNEQIIIYKERSHLWMLGDAKMVFKGKYLLEKHKSQYSLKH